MKKALVVGMAKSGVASARLLMNVGFDVTITDSQPLDKFGTEVNSLIKDGAHDAMGKDPMTLIDTELIVLSPAVPITLPFVKQAKAAGVEVIGEIELGYRYAKAPLLCITGTNGKTTTTALTGEICKAAGLNTYVLGNIGVPIAEKALQTTEKDVIVAEVAGFQLESTINFHTPSCAVLNISEDHLNRFGTMENYIASKEMIFDNQTEKDFAALNADDPVVAAMANKTRARCIYFSRLHEVENGAFVRDGRIIFRLDGRERDVCAATDVKIPGAHNLENALAAVCVTMAYGIPAEAAAQALRTFPGVEHRIEFVCEKNGVTYTNDSKGTNPDSTIKAIQAASRPTVLLLGGSNKNSDYTPVFKAFKGNVRAVVAFGFTRDQIKRDADITGYSAIHMCEGTFEEAVRLASSLAMPGDDVLLSPACASFDMFKDFEQRGEVFKEIVRAL